MAGSFYDEQGNEVQVPDADPNQFIQGAGQVAMVGPDGWAGTIPVSNLAEALKMGFRPEAPEAHKERQLEEQYGDSPIKAGLEGVARGATFGLSDTLLRAAGTDNTLPEADRVDPVSQLKNRNEVAAGIGEAAGFVGTSALTGLGSAAGVAGKAAFGGTGLLARAGAAAVRGGIEGTAMGLGQGISDVALAKDPMTAEAIIGQIGHKALFGGTVGAVGGAALSAAGSAAGSGLDFALAKGGKLVQKFAAKATAELADEAGVLSTAEPALRDEIMGMSQTELKAAHAAEETSLDAVRADQGTALAKDLWSFNEEMRDGGNLFKIRREMPKGVGLVKEGKAAEAAFGKVLQDMKSLAEDPVTALKPIRRLQQNVENMATRLPGGADGDLVKPILDRVNSLESRIVDLSGDATSPRLEAMAERLDQLANPVKTPIMDTWAKGAGAAIGGAIGHATGIPYAGMAGAWLGKEFLGDALKPIIKRVLGSFADNATAIQDGATNLFSKLKPPTPVMDALRDLATASGVTGASDYEKATKAITAAAANPEQTGAGIKQQLAGLAAVAPQTAELVQAGLMAKTNFLASKIPPALSMGITGRLIPPSQTDEATFARYVAAANDPLRILSELRSGRLMPETLETHDALYPKIKERIISSITTQLADPTVASKVPYAMRLQLGMLLGAQVDATLDPSFVSFIQNGFQTPAQPGKAPTSKPEPITAAQRLTMPRPQ